MTRAADLRQLETGELQENLEKRREELFRLRLNWAAGSLENPNQIREARHEIARILTLLRERELAEALVRQEGETNVE